MPNDPTEHEGDTFAALTEVFREVFDDEALVIERATVASDVEEWDSLTHLALIVAVEERFGIKFKLADIVKFRNVGDLHDAILRARD